MIILIGEEVLYFLSVMQQAIGIVQTCVIMLLTNYSTKYYTYKFLDSNNEINYSCIHILLRA